MSRYMPRRLSAITHAKISVALFVLLLVAGNAIFLSACSTTGGGLQGTVASVDLVTSTFLLTPPQNSAGVTSLTVSVSPQTAFHGALHRLSDLNAGMAVSVQGAATTSSRVLVASEVEDENEPNDQGNDRSGSASGNGRDAAELKGTVGTIDSARTSFALQFSDGTSKTVTVSAQTEFEGSLHSFADLTKGERVEVKGTPQTDGAFAASSVEGENENDDQNDDANEIELKGTITSLDSAHTSFILTLADKTTKTIHTTKQTEFDGGFQGFTDLKTGITVEVRGTDQSDGTLLASRVHREDDGSNDSSGSDGHDGSGSGSGSSSGSGDGHGGGGSGGGDGNGDGGGDGS